MGDDPIRVMCVDDNPLVAEAVQRRIAQESRFAWAGWVSHTGELTKQVQRARPDVLLVDVDMPGCDPFEAVQRLAESSPQTRVLMFSGHVRLDYIDRSIEAGAWGYVSKNDDIDEVFAAIAEVVRGQFALSAAARAEQRHQT